MLLKCKLEALFESLLHQTLTWNLEKLHKGKG